MKTELAKQENGTVAARRSRYVQPRYEVETHEHAFEVKVYLPGVPRDGANVTLDEQTLAVEATRPPFADEAWRPLHREIPEADFRLRLQLNVAVDEAAISATSKDGVLHIHLPVAEAAKPRTIEIN